MQMQELRARTSTSPMGANSSPKIPVATDACDETDMNGSLQDAPSRLAPLHDDDGDHPEVDGAPLQHGHPQSPVLGILPFAVIVFYNVSGGPFGIEECVKSAGAFYSLLGFVVFPFIWSLQEAVITAELASAFPHSSGGVRWCEEAWGPGAAWVNGCLSWVSGATDNAIYPALFLDYLIQVLPADEQNEGDLHPLLRFFILAGSAIILAYFNYRGLDVVGRFAIVICVVAMSPFIVFSLVALKDVNPSNWFTKPALSVEDYESVSDYSLGGGFFPNAVVGGVLLRPYLNNLFWNLNSYDAAATFSEDLGNDLGRVFTRGLAIAFFFSIVMYLFPLLVAIGVSEGSQADWSEGYIAAIMETSVGPWLGGWTVFAAGLSNLALFQAEMSADSFQLMGMAQSGYIPAFLGVRSRHGTPVNSIILGTIVIVLFSVARLDKLVEMLNFNYSLSLLMEYAAFIQLRISKPHVPRPCRVPLSTVGCVILLSPTIFFTLVVMVLSSFTTIIVAIVSVAASILIYVFAMRRKSISTDGEIEVAPMTTGVEIT